MKESNIRNKTFLFAIRIVNLYKFLTIEKKEYVMSKQLHRCGTSVGAMICESEYGESRLDFIHKKAIAQKKLMKPYIGLNYCMLLTIYQKINFKVCS
jgi:four helix bundle protein